MKQLIEAFPQNIVDATAIAKASTFQTPKNDIHNIVICGLGGSGIGAKIVSNWIQDEIQVPVVVNNEYVLPAFAGKNTLVIGSSYSGNTEESTSSINEAHAKGCHIIGITSGGNLASFCATNGYDCVIVPGGNPPRSALAFSVVQLLHILSELGFTSASHVDSMNKSAILLANEIEAIQAIGKELAAHLFGKVGVYYAETKYEGVIVRARQQFNENSKYLGWHHTIPEMNHNELVGWSGGDARFAPVFFNTGDVHPRNQKRLEITMAAVEKKCGKVFTLHTKGETLIERSLYLIHIFDWASFYLCDLKGADINDMEIVDYLKDELSKL
jgi:glucose/mannose-6-phosphate isomerase